VLAEPLNIPQYAITTPQIQTPCSL